MRFLPIFLFISWLAFSVAASAAPNPPPVVGVPLADGLRPIACDPGGRAAAGMGFGTGGDT